jgi:DNA-directed RNA polymerase I, II, and III subunit RPABC4
LGLTSLNPRTEPSKLVDRGFHVLRQEVRSTAHTYKSPTSHQPTNPSTTQTKPTTMSREQYQPPATGAAGQTDFTAASAGTTGASNTGFQASGSGFEDKARPVHYLCGDCDNRVTLTKNEPIRCKECGYRVLYKERTNR